MKPIRDRHLGETIIVLGCGPSLKTVPSVFLDRFTTIGTNRVSLNYDPDYLVWIDRELPLREYKILNASKAERFSPTMEASGRVEMIFQPIEQNIPVLEGCKGKAPRTEPESNRFGRYEPGEDDPVLSDDYDKGLYCGASTIFPALNLAVLFGATRIILAGMDLKDNSHCHPSREGKDPNLPFNNAAEILRSFDYIADDLHGTGVEILNLNRRSAVRNFRFVDMKDVA